VAARKQGAVETGLFGARRVRQRITPMVWAIVIYVSADALAEQLQVKTEKHFDSGTRRNSMSFECAWTKMIFSGACSTGAISLRF
jgi:hypothetical protein